MKRKRKTSEIYYLVWALILVLIFVSALLFFRNPRLQPECDVIVQPGESIQEAVDSNFEGATICLDVGVHRLQEVNPKRGNVFFGTVAGEVFLSGARILTDFSQEGDLWYVDGQMQEGIRRGECEAGVNRCNYPEDLFIDDEVLLHVDGLENVEEGTFYFDYDNDRIYFADDPTGKKVEVSVTPVAFRSTADDVTIRNLIVEKYATPAETGAIGGDNPPFRSGWLIEDNEVRFNHGAGIQINPGSIVRRNYVHHNGQYGFLGSRAGDGVLFELNEVAYNNYALFKQLWAGGGGKFTRTNGLIVRNNYVHDNLGVGIWLDIENDGALVEGNYVFDNARRGIYHEIGFDAEIRNNVLAGNGLARADGKSDNEAQIVSLNSDGTEAGVLIHSNRIWVLPGGPGGIFVEQHSRGDFLARNNNVYDNEVYHLSSEGLSGLRVSFGQAGFYASNRFDGNFYHSFDLTEKHWERGFKNPLSFVEFRGHGFEEAGIHDSVFENLPDPPNNVGPVWMTVSGTGSTDDSAGTDGVDTPIETCELTSASWGFFNAQEGDLVLINVVGQGCDGETISFDVREDDSSDGEDSLDDQVQNRPSDAVFSGNVATSVWRAEWQCDGINCNDDPPEYYFVVGVLATELESSKDGRLEVSKLGGFVPPPLLNVTNETNTTIKNDSEKGEIETFGTGEITAGTTGDIVTGGTSGVGTAGTGIDGDEDGSDVVEIPRTDETFRSTQTEESSVARFGIFVLIMLFLFFVLFVILKMYQRKDRKKSEQKKSIVQGNFSKTPVKPILPPKPRRIRFRRKGKSR